jgi:UDP-N-acetylglucosamine--dolichyl-phosphate N-acetylglucosaminephosphotransferase
MAIIAFQHPFILTAVLTFIATLATTWLLIPRLVRAGLVGVDLNKVPESFDRSKIKQLKDKGYPGLPAVPRSGGIAMIFGFSAGMLVSLIIYSYSNIAGILAALLTATLISMIGIVEDFLPIRQIYRTLLPAIAALPLMAVTAGATQMSLPFFGTVEFGIIYTLILIPIGVMAASNLVNLLAGFNGLEAGVGLIVGTALFAVAYTTGNTEAAFIAMALAASCAAFLVFNFYPAKIFPGNAATYMIGAVIAAIAIIGNMERVAVIALAPQIIEFFLKARGWFKAENFGKLGPGGRLSYSGQTQSLTHLLMKTFRPTEKQLVLMLLAIQVCFAGLAIYSMAW